MQFLDRIEEKERIEDFMSLDEGAFACLYGRRRIGKSRLLKEVLGVRKDVVLHIADRSDRVLQRERLARDISRIVPGFANVRYNDWGALFERWLADAPRGSVMVLDEFPYLVETSPDLPSILQRIIEDIRPTGLKLVVCGSSQRMMQGLVLDSSEPLYGRAREIIKLQPIGFEWMKRAFPRLTPFERLEHYAVWGGVPRYWELSEGERSFKSVLHRQIFSRNGLLHEEPSYLLLDDFRDSIQSVSILNLIGGGVNRLSEIASRMEIHASALTKPLKKLLDLGLVHKEVPFGCMERDNKRTFYRLDDQFLAFWYRFVQPNYSNEDYLTEEYSVREFDGEFRIYLGLVWERLVRETLARRPLEKGGQKFFKGSRWWGTGLDRKQMEIDVVAESADRKTLLVGEAKLALSKKDTERTLEDLKLKARMLPFAKDYKKVACRLFVANNPPPEALGVAWAEGDVYPPIDPDRAH